MNNSPQQIHTCKSHNIKQVWNTITSQNHITPTPDYYHKTLCSYILVVNFTASTILGLQKLVLVGMVAYQNMFVIIKCFYLHPNLNEVVSIGSNLIWAAVICPNIFTTSRMQIWMKLFQFAQMVPIVPSRFNYPNMSAAVGICPNASNFMQIWMKVLYIAHIEIKLFEVPQNG